MNQYVREDLIVNNVYSAYKSTLDKSKRISSKEKVKIKNSVLNIVLTLIVFNTLGLLLSNLIITALEKQMPFDVNFVQLSPFEIFNSSIKVAMFVGLYLSSPIIAFTLAKLYPEKLEKLNIDNKFLIKVIAGAFILFAAGSLCAFYILIPGLLYFIMGFNASLATTAINISSYTSFCMQLILLTSLVFELPIFYMVLNKTKSVDSRKLLSLWKPALIASVVISFILTSQDLVTQIFSLGGILILYGLCIFIAKLVEHN